MNSHERYRINEALDIKEALEVIVLGVLLNVFFKFVGIEVSFRMPVLILEILHVCNFLLTCELSTKIEPCSLERSVIDNREYVWVGNGGIDNLLPETSVGRLSEK
jgi:hypothetical protein